MPLVKYSLGYQRPPGPPRQFILGNFRDLPRGHVTKTLDLWTKQYGDIPVYQVIIFLLMADKETSFISTYWAHLCSLWTRMNLPENCLKNEGLYTPADMNRPCSNCAFSVIAGWYIWRLNCWTQNRVWLVCKSPTIWRFLASSSYRIFPLDK